MSFWEPFKNALKRTINLKAIIYFILLESGIIAINFFFDVIQVDYGIYIIVSYLSTTAYLFLQLYIIFFIIYSEKNKQDLVKKATYISIIPALGIIEIIIYNELILNKLDNNIGFLIGLTLFAGIVALPTLFYPYFIMHGKPFMQAIIESLFVLKQNFLYIIFISIIIYVYTFILQGIPQIFFETNTLPYGNESKILFKGIELLFITALVELYTTILLFEIYEKLTGGKNEKTSTVPTVN